jgi:hypothetical protein
MTTVQDIIAKLTIEDVLAYELTNEKYLFVTDMLDMAGLPRRSSHVNTIEDALEALSAALI